MFRENQIVEETTLLKEIQKNKKYKKKEDRQAWKDNGVVYIKGNIYIQNNWKI